MVEPFRTTASGPESSRLSEVSPSCHSSGILLNRVGRERGGTRAEFRHERGKDKSNAHAVMVDTIAEGVGHIVGVTLRSRQARRYLTYRGTQYDQRELKVRTKLHFMLCNADNILTYNVVLHEWPMREYKRYRRCNHFTNLESVQESQPFGVRHDQV